MPNVNEMELTRWLSKAVNRLVDERLNELGIPRLFISGVVDTVSTDGNGNTFAAVYLNGSATSTPNIPVNPDIAANVAASTPVWVFAVNFNNLDLYVAMRKIA